MAKVIEGTEDFSGGPLERPDGSDNGNKFSELVTAFMERIANHDHSGESSKSIFLPPNVQDQFSGVDAPVFSADGTGRYKTTLTMSKGTTNLKNPMFYLKLQADPDLQQNWYRFYPSYDVDSANAQIITLRKLLRNDIDIKVIS